MGFLQTARRVGSLSGVVTPEKQNPFCRRGNSEKWSGLPEVTPLEESEPEPRLLLWVLASVSVPQVGGWYVCSKPSMVSRCFFFKAKSPFKWHPPLLIEHTEKESGSCLPPKWPHLRQTASLVMVLKLGD